MDISKKALLITLIVDLLLLVAGIICLFVTKFNTVALILFVVAVALILVSSIIIWKCGKFYKKQQ